MLPVSYASFHFQAGQFSDKEKYKKTAGAASLPNGNCRCPLLNLPVLLIFLYLPICMNFLVIAYLRLDLPSNDLASYSN